VKPNLKVHHIGCVVENIESAVKTYTQMLGFNNISKVYHIKSQQVKVCFVEIGIETFIEFVEPLEKDSAIGKLLKKRHSYYHTGYIVNDFETTLNDLCEKGAKLITKFKSEAFNNKKCAFIYTPELHMIELIEQ
jgi:methylmalonyl-CoA epimerase